MIKRRTPLKRSTKPIKRTHHVFRRAVPIGYPEVVEVQRSTLTEGSEQKFLHAFGLKRSVKRIPRVSAKQRNVNEFMRQYRSMSCWVCSSDRSVVGHHLLKRSTHPQYVTDPLNIIPLCRFHHRLAHAAPTWLRKLFKGTTSFRHLDKWMEEHEHGKR